MIKYLMAYFVAFILFAHPCIAGVGIGGFPYPGPGIITASSTCDGTQSIISGDIETFERGNGAFCTSEISVYANVDGGVVSTYSTNPGTLIYTHSLEIFDTTAGNHRVDAVRIDIGDAQDDNDWSIRFRYTIETGPNGTETISFFSVGSSSTNPGSGVISRLMLGGAGGDNNDGPFRMQVVEAADYSGYVRTGLIAGQTVCIFIDVNPYTGAGDTSTITVYDEDCTSNPSTSTFEIANVAGRYIWFGGILDDIDPHHFGIDNIEFNVSGGAF